MKPCIFAQDLLGALVLNHRSLYGNLNKLIPTRPGACIKHTLFTQPEYLAVLRSLGNLKQRTAVDGGDLDLRAEAGFIDSNGHLNFDIVAIATEKRMRLDADGNV